MICTLPPLLIHDVVPQLQNLTLEVVRTYERGSDPDLLLWPQKRLCTSSRYRCKFILILVAFYYSYRGVLERPESFSLPSNAITHAFTGILRHRVAYQRYWQDHLQCCPPCSLNHSKSHIWVRIGGFLLLRSYNSSELGRNAVMRFRLTFRISTHRRLTLSRWQELRR